MLYETIFLMMQNVSRVRCGLHLLWDIEDVFKLKSNNVIEAQIFQVFFLLMYMNYWKLAWNWELYLFWFCDSIMYFDFNSTEFALSCSLIICFCYYWETTFYGNNILDISKINCSSSIVLNYSAEFWENRIVMKLFPFFIGLLCAAKYT